MTGHVQLTLSKGLQLEQMMCPSSHWQIGGRDISIKKNKDNYLDKQWRKQQAYNISDRRKKNDFWYGV